MSAPLHPPLFPRNGHTLRVLAICRISTVHQNQQSLADQEAYYRRWLQDRWSQPYEMTTIASQGSGEDITRPDYLHAVEEVDSRRYDLVITEDVARICRRVQALVFAENCEDQETRLIAINDQVDTGKEDWKLNSCFAALRHESYNKDTSRRIRRSLRHRFEQGGVVQSVIFGYVKPAGAKSDADLRKDPAAESLYREWFHRLDHGATFAEIADWLNGVGISPGPACRTSRWNVAMVGRVTRNPIVKGVRVRNARMAKRINKTGKRKSIKAPPEERLERTVPHLAYFEPEYYDRVLRKVNARNAKCRRRGADGRDGRTGIPKKRTLWPGQHLRCGVCGRLFYWTGKREKKLMKCSGALEYRCWNAREIDGLQAARKLVDAVFSKILALPDFDPVFRDKVQSQWQDLRAKQSSKRSQAASRLASVEQQILRITEAISQAGSLESLVAKLRALESEKQDLLVQQDRLDQDLGPEPALPSLEELRGKARDLMQQFVPEDPEAGRILQQLISDLRVYPYRLCDGKAVELRAHLTLDLAALVPGSVGAELLRHHLVVDLFDLPQRVRCREKIMEARSRGLTERRIAKQLSLTQTAVQNAARLHRVMEAHGLPDPYVRLLEPPPEPLSGMRRHLHPRYRFEPLDGSA